MSGSFQFTNAVVSGMPIQNGPHIVNALESFNSGNIFGIIHTPNSELITVQIVEGGTIGTTASLILQLSLDGSNFVDFETWTQAQIHKSITASASSSYGVIQILQIKCFQFRFYFYLGNTTGSSGVNVSYMD